MDKTRACFESGAEDQEFLWNAKPRFGKTLTSYALIQQMGFRKVLVVSNRPSISNSWAEDFFKFLSWQKEYSFISDNDALKRRAGVITRQEFVDNRNVPKNFIAFESLQGLKNSLYFGGQHDSLQWLSELEFDLLIVDESHEGVDTIKIERAFDNIKRKHTLYLSGTPFRQLASAQFCAEQIFNWSYADEQKAKQVWTGPGLNPYAALPRLSLFTYQMSEIIRDKARKGIIINEGDNAVDYAFDLNEFFLTDAKGNFVHEDDVRKFIRALYSQEKYPFSSKELRGELAHTMWYMNRVASAKALKRLLEEDIVFREYKVILAAGNERDEDGPNLKAFDRVKKAIAENEKTITLTVGQLTVGVTIPEWSAVLMLCNMASPAAYMQAAFRAQNPCYEFVGAELLMKENAYVFDFDPARTLVIFDEFATNLSPETVGGEGTGEERKARIKQLLNFLPVIGEDAQGKMVELDAEEVLSIPGRLKSQEVVKHGFMSNFLFQNIGNIFSAPELVHRIMEKLPMANEEKKKPKADVLAKIAEIPVDSQGEVKIPDQIAIGQAQGMFGEKIYAFIDDLSKKATAVFSGTQKYSLEIKEIGKTLKEELIKKVLVPVSGASGLTKGAAQKIEKKASAEIDRKLEKIAAAYEQEKKLASVAYAKEFGKAGSEAEKQDAEAKYKLAMENAASEMKKKLTETIRETFEEKPVELVREAETVKAREEKNKLENEIRGHIYAVLRGPYQALSWPTVTRIWTCPILKKI